MGGRSGGDRETRAIETKVKLSTLRSIDPIQRFLMVEGSKEKLAEERSPE